MKIMDYRKLPKGGPAVGKAEVGDRFRPEKVEDGENYDTKLSPGQQVCVYEVFELKPHGYEYKPVWVVLEKD